VWKRDLALMKEVVKKLPDIEIKQQIDMPGGIDDISRLEGAELRALRSFLSGVDPTEQWGGLKKTITPEGHVFWLCKGHAEVYTW